MAAIKDTVKLYPQQERVVNEMNKSLETNEAVLNVSETGAGKTVMTCAIAAEKKLKLFVVAPKESHKGWQDTAKKFGLNFASYKEGKVTYNGLISFEALRGMKPRDLSHPWLDRSIKSTASDPSKSKTGKSVEKEFVTYKASKVFVDLITKNEVLLVFDEIQIIKNACNTTLAARALSVAIIQRKQCGSFVLGISADPAVDVENLINLLRLFNIIRAQRLYDTDKRSKDLLLETSDGKWHGLKELISECLDYEDPEQKLDNKDTLTQKIIDEFDIFEVTPADRRQAIYSLIQKLFFGIIAPKIMFSAPPSMEKYAFRYYAKTPGDVSGKLDIVANQLVEITEYDPKTGEVNMNTSDDTKRGQIFKVIKQYQGLLVPTFVRKAIEILQSDENKKVVIYFDYLEHVELAEELLKDFNPLVVTGSVTNKDLLYKKFQEHNNKYRLLICSRVGKMCVDLHDTSPEGTFPRNVFTVDGFDAITANQKVGRFFREGMTSNPTIYFMHGQNGGELINRIMNALIRKTNMMRKFHCEERAKLSQLPGEYKEIRE